MRLTRALLGVAMVVLVCSAATSRGGPATELRDAARRTLALDSFRTTFSTGPGGPVLEDVVRPDRYRTAGDDGVDVVVIGRASYTHRSCMVGGAPRDGFTVHTGSRPVGVAGDGAKALALMLHASHVERVRSSSAGTTYRFVAPFPRVPIPGVRFEVDHLTAVVRDGLVTELTTVARITERWRSRMGRGQLTFSLFDAVPPIEAPPADQVLGRDRFVCRPTWITPTTAPAR